MIVEVDPEAEATYVSFIDGAKVVRTVSVGDLVAIDLDDNDEAVGLEVLRLPSAIDHALLSGVKGLIPVDLDEVIGAIHRIALPA